MLGNTAFLSFFDPYCSKTPSSRSPMALATNLPADATETATSNQPVQQAPLLCLPAELRNEIWKLILGGTTFEVYCWPSYCPKKMTTRILNRRKNFSGLLRTCRQIYREALLFPLTQNGFRFKNEDGLGPWFDTFDRSKQKAIAEVHLVTWKAAHMVEGVNWSLKKIQDVLPLQRLSGLERLYVEVRTKSSCKACRQDLCEVCEPRLNLAEAQLREFVVNYNGRVDVVFRRHSFATVAGLQVL
jgi:hypothetical protein